MANVEPISGYSWKTVERYAHAFGAGPVAVFVRPPKKKFKLTDDMYPDLEDRAGYEAMVNQSHLKGAAEAVRAWNKATGQAVFMLVNDPAAADIVVNFGDVPGTFAAYGGAETEPGEVSKGAVTARPDQWFSEQLATHELGHAAGLGHPETKTATEENPYGDYTQVMSGGPKPSKAESRRVASLYTQPSPVSHEQAVARNAGGSLPPKKKKRKSYAEGADTNSREG